MTPSATMSMLQSNYVNVFDFTNQYLPDVNEAEFERYGNRTVSGFLDKMGAEYPFESDKIIWEEQGRLHLKYSGISIVYGSGNDTAVCTISQTGVTACAFRVNQTVFLSSNTNNTSDRAIITAVSGLTFTVAFYTASGGTINSADTITAFVYGSEFKKGSDSMQGSITPTPNIYETSPVIIRDKFQVSGSDMAQIGWIKVSTEDGTSGYYWFIKAQSETSIRFKDYLEMMMIEHVEAEPGSGAAAATGDTGNKGTRGLFAAVEEDGNVWSGGNPTSLVDWDTVIQRLDKQGSIAQNMLFANRQLMLDTDDMLAAQNSSGTSGSMSWGVFDNDKDMALNLGFTGFNRGGYEFYKTEWKYLIDPMLRGGLNGGAVNGILVPYGVKDVRDMNLGRSVKLPFLHVKYRKSQHEDRRYKSWIHGSAGGASTNGSDSMTVEYLSERALVTLGANNFAIFKG